METELPAIHHFYDYLSDQEIEEEDYHHAKRIWDQLGFTSLGDFCQFYLECDVLLLSK